LRVVVNGLFGSLKAVKVGASLELWVSYGRCLLFLDKMHGRWFLRRLHLLRKWFKGKLLLMSSILGYGLQSQSCVGWIWLSEAWCGVVEDGRMAVNCYALDEKPHGLTEKKRNPICFHGGNEARKKKLGLSCSWKKLLKWLWAALDRVSASRFKWVGTKALV
jgi:hypothetical protein